MRQSDYGGLGALMDQAAIERAEVESREPEACPNDGTPLKRNHKGELRCPFDGWEPTIS